LAAQLDAVFEDVQMMWIEGPEAVQKRCFLRELVRQTREALVALPREGE
jgi:hypothetical protein